MKGTVSRGVVYQWNPNNPVNGSLFYAYEYAMFLRSTLYIMGTLSESQLQRVRILFNEKYRYHTTIIVLPRSIDLYTLKGISKLLFIDIRSFYNLKELVPQGVECHVFSNTMHPMWRYTSGNRSVVYYGSYPEYQRYDVECILKIYFGAMRCTPTPQKVNPLINPGTPKKIIRPPLRPPLKYSAFISYLPQHISKDKIMGLLPPIPKPYLLKSTHTTHTQGNILSLTDTLYYIHNGYIDTNNRVIPEFRWFHGDNSVNILYTSSTKCSQDSVYYRTADTSILNYNLDDEDKMICQIQMQ